MIRCGPVLALTVAIVVSLLFASCIEPAGPLDNPFDPHNSASPFSQSLSVTAPEEILLTAGSIGTTFTWTAAEGAVQYHIQIAEDGDFSDLTHEHTIATSSWGPVTLDAGVNYKWRVRYQCSAMHGGTPVTEWGLWNGPFDCRCVYWIDSSSPFVATTHPGGIVGQAVVEPTIYGIDTDPWARVSYWQSGLSLSDPAVSVTELAYLQPGFRYYILQYEIPVPTSSHIEYMVRIDAVQTDGRALTLVGGGQDYTGPTSFSNEGFPVEPGIGGDGLVAQYIVNAAIDAPTLTMYFLAEDDQWDGGDGGTSGDTDPGDTTDDQPPEMPTGLVPIDGATVANLTPFLSWTAVTNTEFYEVQYATEEVNVAAAAPVTASSPSYQLTSPLALGDFLYWRVRAVNQHGSSPWSPVQSVEITGTANEAPTVSIEPAYASVDLGETAQFQASANDPDGDSLTYQWSIEGEGQPGATSTTFSPVLTPSVTTTYTIGVEVGDGNLTATDTATFEVVVTTGSPPDPPTGFVATSGGSNSINLSWTDHADNEDGFSLQRSLDSAFTSPIDIGSVGADVETYTDTGLDAETTYYYRIRAYNSNGESSWAGPIGFTTALP